MLSVNSLAEIMPPVKVRVGVRGTDFREGKEALGKGSGICPDVTGLIGKALGEGSASNKLGKNHNKNKEDWRWAGSSKQLLPLALVFVFRH